MTNEAKDTAEKDNDNERRNGKRIMLARKRPPLSEQCLMKMPAINQQITRSKDIASLTEYPVSCRYQDRAIFVRRNNKWTA